MHLADTLLAMVALSPVALWLAPAPAATPASIEVVFTQPAASGFCDGCRKKITDSITTNPVYTCPNGDSWTLVMGTPTSFDGDCVFVGIACMISGSCKYKRTGTLTYTDLPNNGSCSIYYKENGAGAFSTGATGQVFTCELAAKCKYGYILDTVCEDYAVEFFGSTADGSAVVFNWTVELCCTKCPD